MHAEMWREKLARERALRGGRRRALALRARRARARSARTPGGAGRARRGRGGRARRARRRLRGAARGDDHGATLDPGCSMVTAEKVWEALAEVPDPEIPVISLVDLGVVREVEVDGDRVRVEFTPTFLGCPAQEVMRAQMAEAVRALGAEPRDRRRPRRLLVDRPHHARRAAASSRSRASPRRTRAPRPARRSSSSTRRRSAARTAARRRRAWRTSSARPRAARSATARAAASRSSSSRRSSRELVRAAIHVRTLTREDDQDGDGRLEIVACHAWTSQTAYLPVLALKLAGTAPRRRCRTSAPIVERWA